MTTRNTVILAALAVGIIAGSGGCATSATMPQRTSITATANPSPPPSTSATATPAQSPPAPSAPSACAELGGTAGPDLICHAHSAGPRYTIDISFPVDYADQQPVLDYLTEERDHLVSWVTRSPPPVRG